MGAPFLPRRLRQKWGIKSARFVPDRVRLKNILILFALVAYAVPGFAAKSETRHA